MSQRKDFKDGKHFCPNCRRSAKFYVEDGMTYCNNCDTLQEIATQTEVLGDDTRPIRQTTRIRKESAERISRSMSPDSHPYVA